MSAVHAAGWIPENLRSGKLAFRIGTPAAAKRASFEKYGGSDAGTVIDTEFLNVKNSSLFVSVGFFQGDILRVWWMYALLTLIVALFDIKNKK